MLDIKLIRDSPSIVKESQKKRGLDEKEINKVLELDKLWRSLKEEVDSLRNKRNKISREINEAKKQGKKVDSLLKEAKEVPKQLEDKETVMDQLG